MDVAWFVIRDHRLDDGRKELIRELAALGLPVIVVVTGQDRRPGGDEVDPRASSSSKQFGRWIFRSSTAFPSSPQPRRPRGGESSTDCSSCWSALGGSSRSLVAKLSRQRSASISRRSVG